MNQWYKIEVYYSSRSVRFRDRSGYFITLVWSRSFPSYMMMRFFRFVWDNIATHFFQPARGLNSKENSNEKIPKLSSHISKRKPQLPCRYHRSRQSHQTITLQRVQI